MRDIFISVIAALVISTGFANAQQPPPLQLNVPYHCDGNVIVVVKHCENRNGTEICSLVKGPANGPLGDEIQLPKSQAAAIGLICSTQSGATSQATTQLGRGVAKVLNPPYLSEMPSPDRVLVAMKTNDAHETALRQIWAFYELTEIIKTLSGDREFDRRNGLLPDEVKIITDYQTVQYKVSQAADKAFPNRKPSEDLTYHFSRWDPSFGFKGINIWQFFSEGLQSEFAQIVGKDNARYAAMRAEQRRIAAQGVSADPQPAQGAGSQFIRNDPGTLAARRCVELGGSELECLGKGLSTGFMDMVGISPDAIGAAKGPTTSGVVMNGFYQSSAEMGLDFGPQSVSLRGCGKLIPNSHAYTITKKQNQLLINIKSDPTPFYLSLGNDGKLSGPGLIEVNGQIITGYRKVWMQRYHKGSPVPGDGYWDSQPIYAPKTERCTIGTFTAAPPPPDKNPLTAGLTSAINSVIPQGSAGLRMSGHFAGQGGLTLEFAVDSVVLDCGAAHVKQTYTVENTPTQLTVNVKNGNSPFSLTIQPNGALIGAGIADIAGRVVTGSTENALTFAPKNARCAIGTLSPEESGTAHLFK